MTGQPGYLELLRQNTDFRRLWIGNVVSLLGDWFNFIALIAVVETLTGSPLAIGLIFLTKMLPGAIASTFAGTIVDRFNRRRLMIGADVVRAIVVLGLLLVDSPSRVFLVYILVTIQVVISAIFHPAQSASIPNVTSERELLTANALMSISWSVMLAFGAALGGFATDMFGHERVFVADSITYLISASFIFRAKIPQSENESRGPGFWRAAVGDVKAGWTYLRENPFSGKVATAKAAWAIAGGGLVYTLALAGQQLIAGAPDIGVGILFAVRGIGTGFGPVMARRHVVDRTRWPRLLGLLVAVSGCAYFAFGSLPWVLVVAIFVFVAHSASGASWVLSSVLLQERVEDEYRGRVFASEMLFVLVAETVSTLGAALALQFEILTLRQVILMFATVQIISGLVWAGWIKR